MKAKAILITLAIAFTNLVLPAYPAENTTQYADVAENHWAYSALEVLTEKYSLRLGYPDGTFRGNQPLTRYEMAAIVLRMVEKLNSGQEIKIKKNDAVILDKLKTEFREEINKVSASASATEDQLDLLEMSHTDLDHRFNDFKASLPFIFTGSIGFRYQLITKNFGDLSNSLPQTRVSFGLKNREPGMVDYGLSLVTGAANRPGNTWWKMGDFFSRFEINLDKFFVTYHPSDFFSFTVGKFSDPFSNSELFLDEEITPQGALQTIKFKDISPFFKEFSLTAGEIVISMDNVFGSSFMLGGVTDFKFNLTDFAGLNLRGGYYQYLGEDNIARANKLAGETNMEPRITGNSNSNSLDNEGLFSTGFRIINGFGKIIFRLHKDFPFSVSADYLNNLAAPAANQAVQLSGRLGHSINPGNFFIGYNFKYLQKDAVISLFIEDQLARTGTYAHEGLIGMKVLKNTTLSLTLQAQGFTDNSDDSVYTLRTHLIQGF